MGNFFSFHSTPQINVLVAAEFAWRNHPFVQQLYAHLGDHRKGVGIIVRDEKFKQELRSAQIWTTYSRVFLNELMERETVEEILAELETKRKRLQDYRPFPHNVYASFVAQFPSSCYSDSGFDTAANFGHYETAVFITSGALIGDHPFSPTEDAVAAKDREHCRQALSQLEKDIEDGKVCIHKMTPDDFITFLKSLHASLFSGTSKDGLVMPGQWRRCAVSIRGASWCPPQHDEVPALMDKFALFATTAHEFLPAPIYAFELHLHLAFIHPFADGNGRIARAVLNLALFGQGFPPVIIPNDRKRDFIDTMDAAFGTTRDVYYQMGLQFLKQSCTKLLNCLEGEPTESAPLPAVLASACETSPCFSQLDGGGVGSVGRSHLEVGQPIVKELQINDNEGEAKEVIEERQH